MYTEHFGDGLSGHGEAKTFYFSFSVFSMGNEVVINSKKLSIKVLC